MEENYNIEKAKYDEAINRLITDIERIRKERDEKVDKLAETEIQMEELKLQIAEQKEAHALEIDQLKESIGKGSEIQSLEIIAKLKKDSEDEKTKLKDE